MEKIANDQESSKNDAESLKKIVKYCKKYLHGPCLSLEIFC